MSIKPNNLSKNVVNVMKRLSGNEGLARLLMNSGVRPLDVSPPNDWSKLIMKQDSEYCRIKPVPFDPEAMTEDMCFIRVYYNQGEFSSNEKIRELNLHVDIIVAKSMWLIETKDLSNGGIYVPQIRPYEIMDRVLDLVGKNSVTSPIKLKFDGFQHLAVNNKFDAIRLYSDYFDVETNFHSHDRE